MPIQLPALTISLPDAFPSPWFQVDGKNGRNFIMATKKKKPRYDKDEPQGEVTVITDFLPPPDKLVRPGEMTA